MVKDQVKYQKMSDTEQRSTDNFIYPGQRNETSENYFLKTCNLYLRLMKSHSYVVTVE